MEQDINKSVPSVGVSIFKDMVSNDISPRGRANASRVYAEMIIDTFLSDSIKVEFGSEKFYKMSLGERIDAIKDDNSQEIINTLYRIKDYGDKAAHYNPDINITDEQANKIAQDALGIFELILIQYFNIHRFDSNYNTALIFSTLFPEVRANVLERFVHKVYIRKQYDREIFHKYILALVKSNRSNKASRVLEKYKKKGIIDYDSYVDGRGIIKNIGVGMKRNELPIPEYIADCRRNFEDVLKQISEQDKKANEGLILIISKLLDEYTPSEMGSFQANKIYHSEYIDPEYNF